MKDTTNSSAARHRASRPPFRAVVIVVGSLLVGSALTACSAGANATAGIVSVELRQLPPTASDGLILVTLDRGKTHLSQRMSEHEAYGFPPVAEGPITITVKGICTFETSLGTGPVRAVVDNKHCTISN